MAQVVEAALGQIGLLLEFGQHLGEIFGIDRLAVRVNDDIIAHCVSFTHCKLTFSTTYFMPFQLCHQWQGHVQCPGAGFRFWLFHNDFAVCQCTGANDFELAMLPVDVTPLQTQQFPTAQAQTKLYINHKLHLGALCCLDEPLSLCLIVDDSLFLLTLGECDTITRRAWNEPVFNSLIHSAFECQRQ